MFPLARASTRGAGLFQIVAPRLSPCPLLARSLASSSVRSASPARRPTPSSSDNGVISARDLQREITDLGEQLARLDKARQVQEATQNLPPLREEDLDAFYSALKAPDPPTPEEERLAARMERKLQLTAIPTSRQEAHAQALHQLSARLGLAQIGTASEGTASEGTASEDVTGGELAVAAETQASILVDGVGRLLAIVRRDVDEDLEGGPGTVTAKEPSSEAALPTGLLTRSEWKALAGRCAADKDDVALLRLVDAARLDPAVISPMDLIDEAMDAYARKADLTRCQALMARLKSLKLAPTDHTYHSLVKAHLRSGLPDKAAELLNSLESSTPASLATYTMVLSHVMSHRVPDAKLQLWPMFHRMRMAAHPVPDAPLYALMIRACALGITPTSAGGPPDVERALDLFKEMTTRYGVRPTAEAYNALILACARRRDMHGNSLKLLREMVALERSRRENGLSGFAPDRWTYNALLQGCARTGDLLHARWALAEMLRSSVALWGEKGGDEAAEGAKEVDSAMIEARRPDAQTLSAVFYTYASYQVPDGGFVRASKGTTDGRATQVQTNSPEPNQAASSQDTSITATRERQGPSSTISFTNSLPKTSAELVKEVRALMARIEADNETPGLLSTVRPSATLLHAYASALAAHLPMEQRLEAVEEIVLGRDDARDQDQDQVEAADGQVITTTSNSLFDRLGVKRNLNAFAVLLEIAAKAADRRRGDAVSDRAWALFEAYTEEQRLKLVSEGAPQGGRNVSSSVLLARSAGGVMTAGRSIFTTRATAEAFSDCYAARIHGLAKSGHLDEAMQLLRSFAEKFPVPPRPKFSRRPPSLLAEPDTSALSLRPGAPRSSSVAPAWPRLTFKHLEMLHHRLVAARGGVDGAKRNSDVAYVHWLTTRSEASVRQKEPRVSMGDRREREREEVEEERRRERRERRERRSGDRDMRFRTQVGMKRPRQGQSQTQKKRKTSGANKSAKKEEQWSKW